MELFRSEDMKYVTLTMTNDSSHETVRELGKLQKFHVIDLGLGEKGIPSKQTTAYKKRLQDCLSWERKFQQFKDLMIENGIPMADLPISPIHAGDILDAAQNFLEPIEKELSLNMNIQKENIQSINTLIERQHVLTLLKHVKLVEGAEDEKSAANGGDDQELLTDEEANRRGNLNENIKFRSLVAGTIPVEQQPLFNRMLYRVSRGNAFARYKDISKDVMDPETGKPIKKSVFYVVLLGKELFNRVEKMVSIFQARIYHVPNNREQFTRDLNSITEDLKDKREIEKRTADNIRDLLARLGSDERNCVYRDWLAALSEEKSICNVLMKAHFYLTMVSLEGWIPVEDIRALKSAVKVAVQGTGNPPAAVEIDPINPIHTPTVPPTYFKLNKFTASFQGIVDTYGVPRYKEVNPGLFTIISFPFLFGVMYGDIGHGSFLFIFASLMIYFEQQLLEKQRKGTMGEIPLMAFGGRYIIVLMGIFAIYGGIIYNDFMSIPLNVYGSNYIDNPARPGEMYNPTLATYPCGVDPVWAHKSNELAFYNSMKMKMAVIFGVVQMVFGIILSLYNHIYFQDKLSIYFEFIPRMIFMISTFGYMIFMIIYKWCVDWNGLKLPAPNLIQTMISMFLNVGHVDDDKLLYSGQAGFQTFLVLMALFSVPVMLFVKPYYRKHLHEKSLLNQSNISGSMDEHAPLSGGEESDEKAAMTEHSAAAAVDSHGHGGEYNFSDEMIHQGIHTIEFVLGCVSNTASYLRLWALSLAHAQLAHVFWDKMMAQYGFEAGGFSAFVGFGVWFAATFAVLLCMDTLESFLHALRLHWVEFQNKFFYADGRAFEPFQFEDFDTL